MVINLCCEEKNVNVVNLKCKVELYTRQNFPSSFFSHFRFNKFSIYLCPRPRWLCPRCRWDSATIAKLNLWWITHPEEKGNRSLISCRFYRRKLNKSHSRIRQKFTISLNKIIGLQTLSPSSFSRMVSVQKFKLLLLCDSILKLCTQVWVEPIRQHNSQAPQNPAASVHINCPPAQHYHQHRNIF